MLRHGKQIHYHLISTKGTTHCPEFTYCLLYNYIKGRQTIIIIIIFINTYVINENKLFKFMEVEIQKKKQRKIQLSLF